MDQRKTGQFIAARRHKLGLTQTQLAEKLNVSNKAVSKWETGSGFPDVSVPESLADALGISVIELLRGEEGKHKNQDDSEVLEAVYVLCDAFKKQLRRMRRIVGACVVLIMLLAIGLETVEFLATHGDGYDSGINARNMEIWYENLCKDLAKRGVYQIDIRVENQEYSITDQTVMTQLLEQLAQVELEREYRDWGPQSLVCSLRVYTSGWTPDVQFISTEDSWFDLTFPAFGIRYPAVPAPDLEQEESFCPWPDDDETFYFNACIGGTDAWTVIAETLGQCALA